MVASLTELANLALSNVTNERLGDIQETSVLAETVRVNLPTARDTTLEAHPWNVAMRRAQLPSQGKPSFGYANSYALPTDPYCLRVRDVSAGGHHWTVEGRTLLSDAGAPLPIVYTARIEDPTHWPPLLVEAVALRLAIMLTIPLTQTTSLRSELQATFGAILRNAKAVEGLEGLPQEIPTDYLRGRV